MSEAAAPRYTVIANLRWFALAYGAVVITLFAADRVAGAYAVEIPNMSIGLGMLLGLIAAAGLRFATKSNFEWTNGNRHDLALGYIIVALTLEAAAMGFMFLFDPEARTQFLQMPEGLGGPFAIVIIAIAFVLYGIARVILKLIALRGRR